MSVPVLLALATLLPVCALAAQRADPPPQGHTREIAALRAHSAPRIDGRLDEPDWREAHVAADFWISEYQQPPTAATEVRVLADDKALYLAFICYDPQPQGVQADERRRDAAMGLDDRVMVELDPYHNHRLVSQFTVNARGTQADAMAGGRGRKIDWKGDWQAAAVRTEYGWTAEMAIPFDILDFNPATTTFGVNFVRFHARTQEWSRWADLTAQELREETGHIVGLQLPRKSQATRLLAMPYVSGGMNTLDRAGEARSATATTGVDVRLDVARNFAGMVTVHPDFSQTEDAVLGLGFDYNEKFRPDARPFFQEGAGFFGSRAYFHSGRIPDFLAGAKTFGRVGPYQVGVMALSGGSNGRDDYVATVRRELGATVNAGLTVIGTDRGDLSNQLIAVQSNGRFGDSLNFGVDLATTSTTGGAGDGSRAALSLGYAGPHLQVSATVDRVEDGFFPANGFIAADLLGTRAATAMVAYGRGFGQGWLRRADGSVSFGTRQTLEGMLQRQDLSIYGSAETRSNIQLSGGVTRGPYRPRAGTQDWLDSTYDDRFYTVSAYHYSASGRYGFGATYSHGRFAEEDYEDLAPSFWLRPTSQTSVNYSYERADYFGVSQQHVLSLSWALTPEQEISGRWVHYGEPYYRLAYRRMVRRGLDVFAVFNRDPHASSQFTTKIVWTMNLHSRGDSSQSPQP